MRLEQRIMMISPDEVNDEEASAVHVNTMAEDSCKKVFYPASRQFWMKKKQTKNIRHSDVQAEGLPSQVSMLPRAALTLSMLPSGARKNAFPSRP